MQPDAEREGNNSKSVTDVRTENGSGRGQNLALTGLLVPLSLENDRANQRLSRVPSPPFLDFLDHSIKSLHGHAMSFLSPGITPSQCDPRCGLYRCRANMAHMRQSRSYFGHVFRVKFLKFLFPLRSEVDTRKTYRARCDILGFAHLCGSSFLGWWI